jgi:hypothetical protein
VSQIAIHAIAQAVTGRDFDLPAQAENASPANLQILPKRVCEFFAHFLNKFHCYGSGLMNISRLGENSPVSTR